MNPDATCTLCHARATREYQGKAYCAIHYTVLVKAPKAPVSMVIPDWFDKGRNW